MKAILFAIVMAFSPIAPDVPSTDHPELPGVTVQPDGQLTVPDPRPHLDRTCIRLKVYKRNQLIHPERYCEAAALIVYLCGAGILGTESERVEADFHWWTKRDGRCTHEVETYSKQELDLGVRSHGIEFRWSTTREGDEV